MILFVSLQRSVLPVVKACIALAADASFASWPGAAVDLQAV